MKKTQFLIDKLMIILVTLYSFYYLEPFFLWETFAGGMFRKLFGIIPFRTLIGVAIVTLWIVFYAKRRINKETAKLVALVLLVSLFTVCLSGGVDKTEILSFAWLPYLVVSVFLMLPENNQKESYQLFVLLFTITLILPIIYYILNHLGIQVPYIRLESPEEIKVIRGKFYKLYPLSTQLTSIWDPRWQELRMSGIFDEPGRLGTVAGLILVSEKFRIKENWKNVIIFIGGLLSFSIAFYAITLIYYLINCFDKKRYKNIAIILAGILVYVIVMNIHFDNSVITQFQQRLIFTSNGFSGNNRTNSEFNALMNEFYQSDLFSILFGKGNGAIGEIQMAMNIDGSSYKCMIYNYGFIGFGLSILWLVIYATHFMMRRNADRIQILSILAVYLANMYQRPSVFYMGYMLIFFGGILQAVQKKSELNQLIIKKRRRLFRVKNSSFIGNL